MRQTRTARAASWLPVMIRLIAVGYLLFLFGSARAPLALSRSEC